MKNAFRCHDDDNDDDDDDDDDGGDGDDDDDGDDVLDTFITTGAYFIFIVPAVMVVFNVVLGLFTDLQTILGC